MPAAAERHQPAVNLIECAALDPDAGELVVEVDCNHAMEPSAQFHESAAELLAIGKSPGRDIIVVEGRESTCGGHPVGLWEYGT